MSEKRYFKIFSERHTIGEQNKYIALFDALDHLSVEDDGQLTVKLKSIGINTDYISADKNYLYHLILRSLNVFHTSKTYNLEVKEHLASIEILFHKGLYPECMKLIARAEELAEECENFQLMIDILTWKKRCSGYSLGLLQASAVNKSINKYLQLLNNLKIITDYYYESNILQANHEKQSKNDVLKKLKQILQRPELSNERNALSFTAKIFFHLVHSNYYFASNQKEKEFKHLQLLVNILNNSRTYAVENPLDYVSIYNRLLAIKKEIDPVGFFADVEVLKAFNKKIIIKNQTVSERILVHTYTHELEYHLKHHEFQEALSKIKAAEKEITKMKLEIEPYHLIYFYYLHAVTLVYLGRFKESLRYVNRILLDFTAEARPQVFIRVQLLNVIVHYELANYSLTQTLIKKIFQQSAANSLLQEMEIELLEAISSICGLKHFSFKEESKFFKPLEEKWQGTNENILLENYRRWINAKLKKKTVAEVY